MIAQSVAEILSNHVKLSVEGIDRMYLNVYVPRLQMEQGIAWFFREHRGNPLPSAALMSRLAAEGWLQCKGQALSPTDFPKLCGEIGPAFRRRWQWKFLSARSEGDVLAGCK